MSGRFVMRDLPVIGKVAVVVVVARREDASVMVVLPPRKIETDRGVIS